MEVQKEESKRKNDFLLSLEREENAGHRKTIMDEDKDVCEGKNLYARNLLFARKIFLRQRMNY